MPVYAVVRRAKGRRSEGHAVPSMPGTATHRLACAAAVGVRALAVERGRGVAAVCLCGTHFRLGRAGAGTAAGRAVAGASGGSVHRQGEGTFACPWSSAAAEHAPPAHPFLHWNPPIDAAQTRVLLLQQLVFTAVLQPYAPSPTHCGGQAYGHVVVRQRWDICAPQVCAVPRTSKQPPPLHAAPPTGRQVPVLARKSSRAQNEVVPPPQQFALVVHASPVFPQRHCAGKPRHM